MLGIHSGVTALRVAQHKEPSTGELRAPALSEGEQMEVENVDYHFKPGLKIAFFKQRQQFYFPLCVLVHQSERVSASGVHAYK